ncbi:FAD-dependent oxidoreductase [Solimonas soli]|uniref:FAD-dependent oxidoreductase n=1 Tax=Solimonas soli TaxID=413479 RepID=UPI00047FDB09|nr:GMC family oxidoreductase [Solimonas soli]
MFIDARGFADDARLQAQVCIVGGGAAGIALALRLGQRGIDVVLLEAGGRRHEARTQRLYEGEVTDARLHPPADRYRERRLGGSTATWGGRCVPFDPIDFEARDYIPHSGWPISYEELARYYDEASLLCEAGPARYRAADAFPDGSAPPVAGFAAARFSDDTLERFSCPTDFGQRYRLRLDGAARTRVVLHANVTALRLDGDGNRIAAVLARTLDGRRIEVQADFVVLAAGGLETARLLLASHDRQPAGIGNGHDLVGRYYMCHLAGTIGNLRLGHGVAVAHGYQRSADGVYCRRRFALREDAQRTLRCGNFIARLHHPRIGDPAHGSAVLSLLFLARRLIPYEYAKRLHDGDSAPRDWLAHARNVARDPCAAFAFAWQMLTQRKLASRKFPSIIVTPREPCFSLDFHAEQVPNPSSRVQLSEQRDELGMPRLRIDWRHTQADVDTVQRALAAFAADVRDSGVGRFDYAAESIEQEMLRYGAYGGHHIGTARMAATPRTGVVDTDLRVHGVGNLFVASAAVFPTSSQANPTLTIVALALRLGDHLQRRLAPAQAASPAALSIEELAA